MLTKPRWILLLPLVGVLASRTVSAAQTEPAAKRALFDLLEEDRNRLAMIGDAIFSYAELGFQEFRGAKLLEDLLEEEGFAVTRGVAGIPTAFVASFGEGRPVIGLMADIDGLPVQSQKPGVAYHDPLVEGAPGHGEGHNTNQAVIAGAAMALKKTMERLGLRGTIKVFPGVAEELVGSRGFMAKAGVFDGLDVMLDAHIGSDFGTSYGVNNMGLVSTQF
ncbi:MAG TPA: M20/M25/M40 family metallo-hydrolase, partial [Vicinamibacteria bacterium]|nr:M20/M25/M40 family metallo-hydrolase [Vicinamibacteria bacterium]